MGAREPSGGMKIFFVNPCQGSTGLYIDQDPSMNMYVLIYISHDFFKMEQK